MAFTGVLNLGSTRLRKLNMRPSLLIEYMMRGTAKMLAYKLDMIRESDFEELVCSCI